MNPDSGCDHDTEGCADCQPFRFGVAKESTHGCVPELSAFITVEPAAPPVGYLVLGAPDSSRWFYTRDAADLEVNMAQAFGFEQARVAEVRWAD